MDNLFTAKTEEVLKEIASITEWFYNNAGTLDLDELVTKRNRLAGLTMFLTERVAKTGAAHQLAYVHRKIQHATRTNDYKNSKDTEKRITDKIAENLALADIKDFFLKEKQSEAISERLYLILKQANNLLTAFHQNISLLQKEKEEGRNYEYIDAKIKEIKDLYDNQITTIDIQYKRLVNRLQQKFEQLEK